MAIQDFLGTLQVKVDNDNGKADYHDMKGPVDEEQEELRAPPSSTKFSTPQTYKSPVPIMVTNKFNIRRLSSSGGMDNLKRAFMSNRDSNDDADPVFQPTDNSIFPPQQFSSIEEIVKLFGGKDIITEINILWYFANLHSTNRDTTTPSVINDCIF